MSKLCLICYSIIWFWQEKVWDKDGMYHRKCVDGCEWWRKK